MPMSRVPTTKDLEALIAANAAEIAALKAENEKLTQRVTALEEQLRLERLCPAQRKDQGPHL
jgi:cell division protein FtsB